MRHKIPHVPQSAVLAPQVMDEMSQTVTRTVLEDTNPEGVEDINRGATWLMPKLMHASSIINAAVHQQFALWTFLSVLPRENDSTLVFSGDTYDEVKGDREPMPRVLSRGSVTIHRMKIESHVEIPVETRFGCGQENWCSRPDIGYLMRINRWGGGFGGNRQWW